MKSITKWLLSLYVAGAIITMGFQIYYRYPACSGAGVCGLALAKGVVWSTIWPAYWVIKWTTCTDSRRPVHRQTSGGPLVRTAQEPRPKRRAMIPRVLAASV